MGQSEVEYLKIISKTLDKILVVLLEDKINQKSQFRCMVDPNECPNCGQWHILQLEKGTIIGDCPCHCHKAIS